MAHVTDEDIKRLLKIKDADFGFFILATHSLMERALKEDYDSDLYFGELIGTYLDNFKEKYGTPQYQGASFYTFPKDKQNIWWK